MPYYAYIRVSTDAQDVANQKHGIEEYARKLAIQPTYVEDTITSKKPWKERGLGKLLDSMQKGDTLLAAEISRLARTTLQVLEILEYAMKREINVFIVKNSLSIDGSLHSRITATILGLAAEIEREFISARTKEALAYKKSIGVILGRRLGSKNKVHKIDKATGKEIKKRIKAGQSKVSIAKELGFSRNTLYLYLKKQNG
jgi:DNA invertase Pin-like site-specific DNA recombinase